LNGVFLNGDRVDWRELEDGDEIMIGAFRLYFMRVRDRTGIAKRADTAQASTS
jgi:pSer/pThr/pTyr-binding forkhead associated (FHA) protein